MGPVEKKFEFCVLDISKFYSVMNWIIMPEIFFFHMLLTYIYLCIYFYLCIYIYSYKCSLPGCCLYFHLYFLWYILKSKYSYFDKVQFIHFFSLMLYDFCVLLIYLCLTHVYEYVFFFCIFF